MSSENKQNTSEKSPSKHTLAIHGILRKNSPAAIARDIRIFHRLIFKFKKRMTDDERRLSEEADDTYTGPPLHEIGNWMEKFGWNRKRRVITDPVWIEPKE